jgi:hypothetical protein
MASGEKLSSADNQQEIRNDLFDPRVPSLIWEGLKPVEAAQLLGLRDAQSRGRPLGAAEQQEHDRLRRRASKKTGTFGTGMDVRHRTPFLI